MLILALLTTLAMFLLWLYSQLQSSGRTSNSLPWPYGNVGFEPTILLYLPASPINQRWGLRPVANCMEGGIRLPGRQFQSSPRPQLKGRLFFYSASGVAVSQTASNIALSMLYISWLSIKNT